MEEAGEPGLGIDTTVPSIARMYGGFTLVEPGLTDIWAWRPDAGIAATDSDFMRMLGGVARKD